MAATPASSRPAAVAGKVAFVAPSARLDAEVAAYSEGVRKALSAVIPIEGVAPDAARLIGSESLPVYHLSNDARYGPIYRAALARPGLVVLHDASLHDLLLGTLDEQAYLEEFVFNHGDWLGSLAKQMWSERGDVLGAVRRSEFSMLRRLAETSRGIVVHNERAQRLVKEASAGARCFEIPRWIGAPEATQAGTVEALREGLGIPPDAVVIGCFGPFQPRTRIRSLLEAVQAVSVPHRLLLVGEFTSREYERALRPHLESAQPIRLPHPSGGDGWPLARLVDIHVSLSHPSTGHTSPSALRSMAAGMVVLVMDGDENNSFPPGAVIRIDPGEPETEMLAHFLCALSADREMREAIGSEANSHVLDCHSLENAARRYQAVVLELLAG